MTTAEESVTPCISDSIFRTATTIRLIVAIELLLISWIGTGIWTRRFFRRISSGLSEMLVFLVGFGSEALNRFALKLNEIPPADGNRGQLERGVINRNRKINTCSALHLATKHLAGPQRPK